MQVQPSRLLLCVYIYVYKCVCIFKTFRIWRGGFKFQALSFCVFVKQWSKPIRRQQQNSHIYMFVLWVVTFNCVPTLSMPMMQFFSAPLRRSAHFGRWFAPLTCWAWRVTIQKAGFFLTQNIWKSWFYSVNMGYPQGWCSFARTCTFWLPLCNWSAPRSCAQLISHDLTVVLVCYYHKLSRLV